MKLLANITLFFAHSIIQDCEDALTNWVQQNAAVSSKLSTRTRTLSQRRAARRQHAGEGVDLSGQDAPLDSRESGIWVPAGEHRGAAAADRYDDSEEEERTSAVSAEPRGREEERAVAA